MKPYQAALFVLLGCPLALFSQAGVLDPTFGTNGIVLTDLGALREIAHVMTVQPDDKILVCGAIDEDLLLQRFEPDGSLDITFGNGGWVTISEVGDQGYWEMVLQPDGKFIVAGARTLDSAATWDVILRRFLPDGSVDSGFGTNGLVVSDATSGDRSQDLFLQPDGKIVLIAWASNGGNDRDYGVFRYMPDGSLDTTFSDDGWVSVGGPLLTADNVSNGFLLPDGKILLAGEMDFSGFGFARLLPNGDPDSTFNGTGVLQSPIPQLIHLPYQCALQPDGKVLFAYRDDSMPGDHIAVARFNADGSLDMPFGQNGFAETVVGNSSYPVVIRVQDDGKILVGGQTGPSFQAALCLVRYLPNGDLDPSFSTDGIVTTMDLPLLTEVVDFAPQSDGKLVCLTRTPGNYPDVVLVRYQWDAFQNVPEMGNGDVVHLSVTPNPVEDFARLDLTTAPGSEVSIDLFDAVGAYQRTLLAGVRTTDGHVRHQLDCAGLATGAYFARVSIGGAEVPSVTRTVKLAVLGR